MAPHGSLGIQFSCLPTSEEKSESQFLKLKVPFRPNLYQLRNPMGLVSGHYILLSSTTLPNNFMGAFFHHTFWDTKNMQSNSFPWSVDISSCQTKRGFSVSRKTIFKQQIRKAASSGQKFFHGSVGMNLGWRGHIDIWEAGCLDVASGVSLAFFSFHDGGETLQLKQQLSFFCPAPAASSKFRELALSLQALTQRKTHHRSKHCWISLSKYCMSPLVPVSRFLQHLVQRIHQAIPAGTWGLGRAVSQFRYYQKEETFPRPCPLDPFVCHSSCCPADLQDTAVFSHSQEEILWPFILVLVS